MGRVRTRGRDRSKFGEIDAYLSEIGEKDAMEILRAVMYGFSGQVCSKQKAVAFVGGSRKWLDKVCMRAPEVCKGKREDKKHSVTDYDVIELMKRASIVHL